MLKSPQDYVFIEVEGSLYNEDSGIKGHDGTSIKIDTSYDPQVYAKICGKVVSLPDELGDFPISQETLGSPSYGQERNYKYKRREDIEMEIRVGDVVYFHFNLLSAQDGAKNRIKGNIYKISYENIFCSVRDAEAVEGYEDVKEIQMIGGYCLIEPNFESWEDILIPVPQMTGSGKPMVDKQGNTMYKSKDQWIQAKTAPGAKALEGFVVNIGTPLKGDSLELERGDKIWYRTNADWKQKIEGVEYYIIRQRHIVAKVA